MNYKEKISKRQEANFEIAGILENHENPTVRGYAMEFMELAQQHPQWRAGQIFCNELCADYRDGEGYVSPQTQEVLGVLFPNDPDPFFEESIDTLNRLKK